MKWIMFVSLAMLCAGCQTLSELLAQNPEAVETGVKVSAEAAKAALPGWAGFIVDYGAETILALLVGKKVNDKRVEKKVLKAAGGTPPAK